MATSQAHSHAKLNRLLLDRDFRLLLTTTHKTLRKHPKDEFAWLMLGKAFMGLQHWVNACQTFQHIVTLNPKQEEAQLCLAHSLSFLGMQTQSLSLFETVLKNDMTNFNVWSSMISLASEMNLPSDVYKNMVTQYGQALSQSVQPELSGQKRSINRRNH